MHTIADPKTGVTYRTVLLKAADVIRRRGHYQNGAENSRGGLCVMAALGLAREELGIPWDFGLHTQTLCAIQWVIGGNNPVSWNYSQTAESVIDMLERAALS